MLEITESVRRRVHINKTTGLCVETEAYLQISDDLVPSAPTLEIAWMYSTMQISRTRTIQVQSKGERKNI